MLIWIFLFSEALLEIAPAPRKCFQCSREWASSANEGCKQRPTQPILCLVANENVRPLPCSCRLWQGIHLYYQALFVPTKDASRDFTFGTINVINYKQLWAPSSVELLLRKMTDYLRFLIKNLCVSLLIGSLLFCCSGWLWLSLGSYDSYYGWLWLALAHSGV